jgi:thioredoxin reductase
MVTSTDYLIIGAGPGGLQLGYFLQRAGRDYLILEQGSTPGTFFRTFPRHRELLSINKPHTGSDDAEFNLRMDWNSLLSDQENLLFTRYSQAYFPDAAVMVRYLTEFAERTGLNVRYNTTVVKVDRDEQFQVTDQHGEVYRAPLLIVATGAGKSYLPRIPGIESAERYGTVSVDPQDFRNQRVLIIGKGNAAFETANNVLETAAAIHVAGPRPIRMAWRTRHAGNLRAVNNNFLDTCLFGSQNAVLDGQILNIDPGERGYRVRINDSKARVGDPGNVLTYDRVIVCTGFRFDNSIFTEECRPDLLAGGRLPALTSAWESVNVPDLYFAGTLMQAREHQESSSGFISGFRYCVKALHRILERRYHGTPWPPRGLPADAEALTVAVLSRASRASALWQHGLLCDLVVLEGAQAAYYEELPVEYAHESRLGTGGGYLTITLERRIEPDLMDPFDGLVGTAAYPHPVVRHYHGGSLIAEHHVAGNVENDWSGQDTHREPLRAFLARELAPVRVADWTGVTAPGA